MTYFTKHWGLKIDDGVRRGHARMVVGFTTSCAINVCHQRKF